MSAADTTGTTGAAAATGAPPPAGFELAGFATVEVVAEPGRAGAAETTAVGFFAARLAMVSPAFCSEESAATSGPLVAAVTTGADVVLVCCSVALAVWAAVANFSECRDEGDVEGRGGGVHGVVPFRRRCQRVRR